MTSTDEQMRAIKRQFRRAMNGIVAAGMRERGVVYRVNFGLTLPLLKRIASQYTPDRTLAERLWGEQVRESKMLATWLYPADEMTWDRACRWVDEIPYAEIADLCCMNLFSRLPYAFALAAHAAAQPGDMALYTAVRLWNRLLGDGRECPESERHALFGACRRLFAGEGSAPALAAAADALRRLAARDEPTHRQVEIFFAETASELPPDTALFVREIL